MFANLIKKRAIKSYIRRLGKDLARRYGKSKEYTSGQVIKTVQDEGYNWRHICYAHALYTSMKQFDKLHQEQGENCDYYEMRNEIAESFFGGVVSSMESAVFSYSSSDPGGADGGSGGD
ncbi:MAG: DUF6559 family protein [Aestuariibacter sp.]